MIKFKSFEEISAKYPIDGVANAEYSVFLDYENALTDTDLKIVKAEHEFGWYDKELYRWYFYRIYNEMWYDFYLYDGETWILGKDSWDGVGYAEAPVWGTSPDIFIGKEYANFHTYDEAVKYALKKIKERLEF